MHLLYRSNNFWKTSMEILLCLCVNDLRHSLFHLLNCLITTTSELREKPKVTGSKVWTIGRLRKSWCPSWSNSVWQGWSCGLVYYPGGNSSEPIWKVLASSDGISFWTPLKPQHSNRNPNHLAHQFLCIDFLTFPTPLISPHRLLWISYATQKIKPQKQSEAFHTIFVTFFSKFKTEFYCISFF